METKQRARKLVEKFIAHTYCNNNNELQCKEKSKQCALIAVDEIIDSYIQEKNNGYIVSEKIFKLLTNTSTSLMMKKLNKKLLTFKI